MAVGRRIISIVTCTFFAHGLQLPVVCAQGAFGSDAVAGIVVACVAVLMIVIGVVAVYLVWRSRRRAAKNTNSAAAAAAAAAEESVGQEGGHAHPVDIPIEAVNRIPPPAYSHQTTRRPPGSHHRRSREQNACTTTPLDRPRPPPPYSPPEGSATSAAAAAAVDISCDEAPPEYRSRVGLNSSGPDPRPRSDPQSVSVESFAEYPSMRNILLTSSRSSLQGTDSRHASTQSDRSSSAGTGGGGGGGVGGARAVVSMLPAGRPSSPRQRDRRRRGRDSAQGDSVYSRSISTSSSALNDPRVSVPEGGLQRKARRSKQAATTGHSPGGALNRSCPSLVDEAAAAAAAGRINTSHHQPHHRYDDDDHHHHHHHHSRRLRVSAEEERDGNPKSESTKRGRYQGRGATRAAQLSSSTEYSDDHRGYSTDSDLVATGPRTDFGGRFQIAGTTEV